MPPNIEAVAAVQRRREIKARGLKEANCAVRFFFIDNTYRRVLVRKCFLLQVRQRCRDFSGLATLSVDWTMPRTADRKGFLATLAAVCQKTGWQVQAYRLMSNSVGRRGRISTFDTAVSIFYTAKMALFSEGHQSPDCQLGATTAMAEDAASGEASAWAWV